MKHSIKILISVLLTCLLLVASIPAIAIEPADSLSAHDNITRSYQEELLVEYYVYHYIDGRGVDTRVIYNKKYKTFLIPHSYTYTETTQPLSLDTLPFNAPAETYSHYKVTITYDVY